MARTTVLSPVVMKLETPGWLLTESASASRRAETKGVNTSPSGSTMLRRQFTSPDPRVKSPGTPRSKQLAGILTAGSAVAGVHAPEANASKVIALKSACDRLRLVRLKLYPSSPPRIGCLSTLE